MAALKGYKSKPRRDSTRRFSVPANSRRFVQRVFAVMPDPNRDSNSNGRSENQRHNNPWPFARKSNDMKVFLGRFLVAMSLRQCTIIEHLWSYIRYSLIYSQYNFLLRMVSCLSGVLERWYLAQRLSHRSRVLEL